jgi:hypothetical protein
VGTCSPAAHALSLLCRLVLLASSVELLALLAINLRSYVRVVLARPRPGITQCGPTFTAVLMMKSRPSLRNS